MAIQVSTIGIDVLREPEGLLGYIMTNKAGWGLSLYTKRKTTQLLPMTIAPFVVGFLNSAPLRSERWFVDASSANSC